MLRPLAQRKTVRRLRDIRASGSAVQPREVLAGRRLGDAELVGGGRDRAGGDVGAHDFELATGRSLAGRGSDGVHALPLWHDAPMVHMTSGRDGRAGGLYLPSELPATLGAMALQERSV